MLLKKTTQSKIGYVFHSFFVLVSKSPAKNNCNLLFSLCESRSNIFILMFDNLQNVANYLFAMFSWAACLPELCVRIGSSGERDLKHETSQFFWFRKCSPNQLLVWIKINTYDAGSDAMTAKVSDILRNFIKFRRKKFNRLG